MYAPEKSSHGPEAYQSLQVAGNVTGILVKGPAGASTRQAVSRRSRFVTKPSYYIAAGVSWGD